MVIQDRGVGGNQEHEVQGGERGREVAGLVAPIVIASERKRGGHIKIMMSLQRFVLCNISSKTEGHIVSQSKARPNRCLQKKTIS